jgi:micrococcal nuclease
MSWRRASPWLILFALLAGLGARGLPGGRTGGAAPGAAAEAVITRVVDGDTVKVRIAGQTDTVRYIGMDTPETKKPGTPIQCYGKAASAYNERLVAGRSVRLRFDAERRDRYGRLLAYVFRRPDGLFVNAQLVREGFARTLTIPPNVAHVSIFRTLEHRARERDRGLWSSCGVT